MTKAMSISTFVSIGLVVGYLSLICACRIAICVGGRLGEAIRDGSPNAIDDTTVLRLLLKWGSNANGHEGGEEPLLISAAGAGAVKTTRLLLAYGADVHLRDKWGRTALMLARENGYQKIIALLTQAGAKE